MSQEYDMKDGANQDEAAKGAKKEPHQEMIKGHGGRDLQARDVNTHGREYTAKPATEILTSSSARNKWLYPSKRAPGLLQQVLRRPAIRRAAKVINPNTAKFTGKIGQAERNMPALELSYPDIQPPQMCITYHLTGDCAFGTACLFKHADPLFNPALWISPPVFPVGEGVNLTTLTNAVTGDEGNADIQCPDASKETVQAESLSKISLGIVTGLPGLTEQPKLRKELIQAGLLVMKGGAAAQKSDSAEEDTADGDLHLLDILDDHLDIQILKSKLTSLEEEATGLGIDVAAVKSNGTY